MKALGFSLLLLLAAPLLAQGFTPYVAEVTGDSVRLRSGASMAHPPIHVLETGEELVVVGEKGGWAIVRRRANAPCWLGEMFVKAPADGKGYTVTGKNVNLRCSSDTKFFPIGQVDTGASLVACIDGGTGKPIVENSFVRVIPPREAKGAVSAEFIKRVRDLEEEPAPAPVAPAPETPAEPVPQVKAELAPAKEPERVPTKEELDDERKTFAELEKMLADELKKPAAEISLSGIRKMFEQFNEFALAEEIRTKASGYIAKIEATEEIISLELKRLAAEDAKRKAELERIANEAKPKEPVKEEPKGPVEYLVTGTVGSHGKTAKTPASHRLFDENGKVLYDMRWDKGDLAKLMGSRVGIVGKVKKFDSWPHEVIIIERIDVLEDGEEK